MSTQPEQPKKQGGASVVFGLIGFGIAIYIIGVIAGAW